MFVFQRYFRRLSNKEWLSVRVGEGSCYERSTKWWCQLTRICASGHSHIGGEPVEYMSINANIEWVLESFSEEFYFFLAVLPGCYKSIAALMQIQTIQIISTFLVFWPKLTSFTNHGSADPTNYGHYHLQQSKSSHTIKHIWILASSCSWIHLKRTATYMKSLWLSYKCFPALNYLRYSFGISVLQFLLA